MINFSLSGLLPPATKLGQGNIFRSVCQEFCPQQEGRVWQGMCMAGGHAWQGGMCGRGCAWWGACVAGRACMAGGCAWQILQDTVNERVVRILLECILLNVSLESSK